MKSKRHYYNSIYYVLYFFKKLTPEISSSMSTSLLFILENRITSRPWLLAIIRICGKRPKEIMTFRIDKISKVMVKGQCQRKYWGDRSQSWADVGLITWITKIIFKQTRSWSDWATCRQLVGYLINLIE